MGVAKLLPHEMPSVFHRVGAKSQGETTEWGLLYPAVERAKQTHSVPFLFTVGVTEMLLRRLYSCAGCHDCGCQECCILAMCWTLHMYIQLIFITGGGWLSHFQDEGTGPGSILSEFYIM